MSIITKESIADTIEGLEQLVNRGIQSVHIDMAIAGMHRLLASLEAEPIYQCEFCHHDGSGELQWHWEDVNKDFYDQYDSERRGKRRIIYTAPPAPVVPDEKRDDDGNTTSEFDHGWNACREAMLHGTKPSKMCGIMPDYEGGVMTQRECFQAGWEAHHAAMLQVGAPVQFGWSKGHFGYHTLFNAIGKAVNIQGNALSISVSAFEDAMLAAASQQEVK